MYPILFSVKGVTVYSHGVMMAAASIVGGVVIYYVARGAKLNTKFLFDLVVFSLLGGLFVARLFYFVSYRDQFVDWREFFLIWYGGLVSFGGILGGFGVAYGFLKKRQQPIFRWLDVASVGFWVGWAVGRLGCFLNDDTPGLITNSKIAIWSRYPVALFESIYSVIIAVVLFILLKQTKIKLKDGAIFVVGLCLYLIGRFGIDFFRDEAVILWKFNSGQLTSAAFLAIILISIGALKLKAGKENQWQSSKA